MVQSLRNSASAIRESGPRDRLPPSPAIAVTPEISREIPRAPQHGDRFRQRRRAGVDLGGPLRRRPQAPAAGGAVAAVDPTGEPQVGRAAHREGMRQYVWISAVVGTLYKKN